MLRRVAVLGAGTIGSSWARVFARAGLDVRVHDPLARVDLPGVAVCGSVEELVEGAEYVQECVPEELAAKRAAFAALDRHAPTAAILGSSASTLPMTEIARGLERPERCLVVHPTNPPHLVPLVELVPGERTDPEVVERAEAFMRELGQEPIRCRREVYGFVLNRLQMALLREALRLVRDGVASVADVDRCVTSGLALRWAFLGPFAVEETNAASIEEDLGKFGEPIRRLFAEVAAPFDGPDEGDVARAAAGLAELLAAAGHDGLVAYRDEMVARLRALKEAHPLRAEEVLA